MFRRQLNPYKKKSFFLFGPRGVGKSTLLHAILDPAHTHFLDLLDFELSSRLLRSPGEFAQILKALPPQTQWVVLDEIQKIPALLDEVHRSLFHHPQLHFALTGSSARKLKKGSGNLLAGRALTYRLFPLSVIELKEQFHLEMSLEFGTLPEVVLAENPSLKKKILKSYVETYLKEEVFMEGLVRQLASFQKFLPIAASENGQVLSWSNIAGDVGIDAKTIRSYFEILEDTLVGFFLPPYSRSLRKKQKTHPKFYFFDSGVKRAMANELSLPLQRGTSEFGKAFEHFWITEIYRQNEYLGKDYTFSYFGTPDIEIDLVIERPGAHPLMVEFKSAERVRDSELYPLKSIAADFPDFEFLCISSEPRARQVGPILICPWQEGLGRIFPELSAPRRDSGIPNSI